MYILSPASEVGSLTNHLGSRQRQDTSQRPFSPLTGGLDLTPTGSLQYLSKVYLMTDYLELKNTDRHWTCFTKAFTKTITVYEEQLKFVRPNQSYPHGNCNQYWLFYIHQKGKCEKVWRKYTNPARNFCKQKLRPLLWWHRYIGQSIPQNVLKNENEKQYKTKKPPPPFGEGPNSLLDQKYAMKWFSLQINQVPPKYLYL